MCLIINKPEKITLPGKKQLRKAFETNSDGAGLAIRDKERWIVSKGYMVFSDLMRGIKEYKDINDREVILHFRMGTSGLDKPGNTHPFPISDDTDELRALDYSAPWIAAHNGILGQGQYEKGKGMLTDTQVYIRDVLANPIILKGLTENIGHTIEILKYTINGDKLIIGGPKHTILLGNWQEKNGCFYSNLYWNRKTTDWSKWIGGYDSKQYFRGKSMTWEDEDMIRCKACNQMTYDLTINMCDCGYSEEDVLLLKGN